jgi:predicted acetyltransferase
MHPRIVSRQLRCVGGGADCGQNGSVSWTVRRLTDADAERARQLGFEAFGVPATPQTSPPSVDQPGWAWFGAFDGDVLSARMVDREFDSWFGGVALPTSGIAGVTVAAEYRGQGLLTPLFTETLRHAKERGALISGLFPSAAGIYRRFGYELIADYVTVEVRTQGLAAVRKPDGLRTRRASAADFDSIRGIYDAWASAQNGPLTRRGSAFTATAEQFIQSFTGVTLAVDEAGSVCGFASWSRGEGYGEKAVIEVADLLATTADGYRALHSALGSFVSVTPTIRIDTSGDDLGRLFLPGLEWRVAGSSPYMLKILDVSGPLSALQYPPSMTVELVFSVTGDFLTENNGSYRLEVANGFGKCSPDDQADRTFTPQGLALLFAGAQCCANLRSAGYLRGGNVDQDLDWDALFGGRQPHIRDYY